MLGKTITLLTVLLALGVHAGTGVAPGVSVFRLSVFPGLVRYVDSAAAVVCYVTTSSPGQQVWSRYDSGPQHSVSCVKLDIKPKR